MATLQLDILVIPTYDTFTLGIVDASTYTDNPPVVSSPTIEITPPGFDTVVLPFMVDNYSIYNSTTLGITTLGDELVPIPDGIYSLKYSVAPSYLNFVEKSIMRVDRLQERFDEAFMKLDMMECDKAIKYQAKVDLNTIYFFIQGAMASANNCAKIEASKLYETAFKMLSHFITNNCGCHY